MNKLSLRESRLLLGLQTTAPLLQRPRTHWDHLSRGSTMASLRLSPGAQMEDEFE